MARGLVDYPNRTNSLNAIRLALATAVIVSHSWPVGGYGGDPQWGRVTLGHFAVFGFFGISGWLITQSRESTALPAYLWRRFLRIYPGFLAALLVTAVAFAPIGSALGGGTWSLRGAVIYVVKNAAVHISVYDVGGTPSGVPYPRDWNGSLWTLFFEVLCYLLIGFCVSVVPRRCLTPAVIALWIVVTAGAVAVPPDTTFAGLFFLVAPYFLAGSVLFVLRERIPLHWGLGLPAVAVTAAVIGSGGNPALAAVPLAYGMLWLGAALPFHGVGRRNDFSYGMYVYAFPVQQLLVLVGWNSWPVGWYALACILCTVPFAVASWFAVERPAQRFRRAADRVRLRAGSAGSPGSGRPAPG